VIGRIVRSADFERVLGTPSRARSAHFAVHHLAASPSLPRRRPSTGQADLSTGDAPNPPQAVDDSPAQAPREPAVDVPQGCWLGYVVPKRHARRAVTRSLLKRQIRHIFADLPALPPGLWVVRLRLPFDKREFPSAASDALRAAARAELLHLARKLAPQAPAPTAPAAG
jgi:ribonuclease P protein component